jgi:hypothetical protein
MRSSSEQLIHRIEIDEEAFEFSRAEEIYTIASILKVRALPTVPCFSCGR